MSFTPKILFITNEEHGQSNIHLTILTTLSQLYPRSAQVDLHLCSFAKLAPRCPTGTTFHTLEGEGMAALCAQNWATAHPGQRPATGFAASHPPTTLGVIRNSLMFRDMLFPWSDSAYLDLVNQTRRVIEAVEPDLVLVDPLCAFGIDAARSAKANAVTLSPVSWSTCARVVANKVNRHRFPFWPGVGGCQLTIQDIQRQPLPPPMARTHPQCLSSDFFAVLCLLFLPSITRLNRVRASAGLTSVNPVLDVPKPVLCPGTMALDFAGAATPDVLPFGPIMMSYPPLKEAHFELAIRLQHGDSTDDGSQPPTGAGKGKTVLIALGSHVRLDEAEVRAMRQALRAVLTARPDIKVLWKLVPDEAPTYALSDLDELVKEMDGRLRVPQWLEADPAALLQSGYIGAFVHHGGGNSYHEALGTGVPQIVLASWMDCYTFARRVVDLGIGVWANRSHAPTFTAGPLRKALFTIIGSRPKDHVADGYAERARQAAIIARSPDSIPLAPDGVTELDIVRETREAAQPCWFG